MSLKHMTRATLLLALGLILHTATPSFIGMMKPDFMLCMMFICLYKTETFSEAVIISMIAGVLSGMTSQMPYGLISNLIDKLMSGLLIFHMAGKYKNFKCLTFFGTILSGIIFLSLSKLLVPLHFSLVLTLFISQVIPAAIINTLFYLFLHSKMKHFQFL